MNKKIQTLKVENLSIQFRSEGDWKTVVDGINFHINKGEIVGLVGESGSGKTMTALFILGLVPGGAKISFAEYEFLDKKPASKNLRDVSLFQKALRGKSVGMIFQEPMSALNPTMPCGKQLTEIILTHLGLRKKDAEAHAKDCLKKVQLSAEHFDRYPHQLSGGQQQRVVIAMAICCEPKLLIADEPTTALDATVRKDILELLKNLSETEELSILFISHDLPAVGSVANRIMVMKSGKIMEAGNAKKILLNPQNEYTRDLLNCLPTLEFAGDRLPVSSAHHDSHFSKQTHSSILNSKILRIENLSVHYKNNTWLSFNKKADIKAVINLNFEVFEGETLGIVGESGSGKSSLGKAILNLVESKSGNVFYKNTNLTELSDNQWFEFSKDLQIVFQNPLDSLNPRQPIGLGLTEVLSVFRKNNSSTTEKNQAVELLRKVGLEESDFYKYPHEFSGGQRQRICIARALAVEPKILICDECVSSLDVSVQARILNLLKNLQEQFGLTLLFISHDLGVVKFMSDRILVMKNGEAVQIEKTETLFETPENAYVKELINAVPRIHNQL